MVKKQTIIGVIGGHTCNAKVEQLAHELGRNIAKVEAILVCGGLSGVMKAVAKGVKSAGGITIGIIPGEDKAEANPYIDIVIPTGLGLARNTLVVRTADVIIALPGEYGTLSEIAFALVLKKKVIDLGNWDISGTIKVDSAEEAIKYIKEEIQSK
ncbi:MAG: TIGR00725 family protein [Candidatus Margulisiibacteriota bacterium]